MGNEEKKENSVKDLENEAELLLYMRSSFIGRMVLDLFLSTYESTLPPYKYCIKFTEILLRATGRKNCEKEFWRNTYIAGMKNENPFSIYLQSYIEDAIKENNINLSDIYKSSGMSKQTFLRIKNGQIKTPAFDSVLQLAIGLKLDERDTNKLVAVAGYRHEMKGEVGKIVLKHIQKNDFNIDKINKELWKKCGKTLGFDE